MFKKSFKRKIILPTILVLVILLVVLNIFLSVRFMAFSDYLVNEKLIANINGLDLYLNNSKDRSLAVVISTTLDHDIIKAVKERDTDKLLRIFTPMCSLFRMNFFTICDNKGIVLARTHEPGNFGDSVYSQQNIKNALSGKASSYFESGSVVKVSVRSGAPVYDNDGKLIGAVSAGVRFDTDSAVNELKSLLNSEVTVFSDNVRVATTVMVNGQNIAGTKLAPHVEEVVIGGKQEYSGNVDISGVEYKAFYRPLLNARGEVFAVIFFGIPLTELRAESIISIRDGIIIGLIGLAISVTLLFFFISSISRPIIMLSGDMDKFANGDMDISINTTSEDEVGRLGKSLQKAVSIIKKLLAEINTMMAEQEKGNTDYRIDSSAFNGDYKLLADNIFELATFGMKDQLTGIPNRRSFDNRMNLEWSRAKREKTPISILMIDIDRFKNYNDSFGHQQGDIALQAVTNAFMRSIRRTGDFAARWGGEEFIVLLPNTNSTGALSFAENIRADIENTVIPCVDKRAEKITVSIGINTQIPDKTGPADDLIFKADQALYKAKEAGRNKVCRYN